MPRVVDGLSSGLEFDAPDLNINSRFDIFGLARQTFGRHSRKNRRDFVLRIDRTPLSLSKDPDLAAFFFPTQGTLMALRNVRRPMNSKIVEALVPSACGLGWLA